MEHTAAEPGAAPVMVPLDGSALAERAVPWGLAAARQEHAPLLLIRVVSTLGLAAMGQTAPASEEAVLEAERETAAAYLAETAAAVGRTAADVTVATDVCLGDAAVELLAAERMYRVRLVVLTTHGRSGLSRWMRGSVAEQILRDSAAPVLLVRPWDMAPAGGVAAVRRVLVPLDGSPFAEGVLDAACRLVGPRQVGGEVVLVSVVPREGHTAHGPPAAAPRSGQPDAPATTSRMRRRESAAHYLETVAAGLRENGYRVRQVVLSAADAGTAIVDQAILEEADVIAMSTHGRSGFGRLLFGSAADHVLRAARVPVLLYRPRAPGGDGGGRDHSGATSGGPAAGFGTPAPADVGPAPAAHSQDGAAPGA